MKLCRLDLLRYGHLSDVTVLVWDRAGKLDVRRRKD